MFYRGWRAVVRWSWTLGFRANSRGDLFFPPKKTLGLGQNDRFDSTRLDERGEHIRMGDVWGAGRSYMYIHFMSRVADHSTFFRKSVKGVAGYIPRCFDIIFRKELE